MPHPTRQRTRHHGWRCQPGPLTLVPHRSPGFERLPPGAALLARHAGWHAPG